MTKSRKSVSTGQSRGQKVTPALVNKLANSMPGRKKVRPARGRKLSNRAGAADSGVVVVKNPVFSSNAQVVDGVRTIDIVCQMNPQSLMRLVNSWVQYYVVINGNTLIPGVDTTDLQDIAATLTADLVLSMGGLISFFVQVDQPAIYRDLFEAISPKTTKMSPTVQTRYSWNPATFPSGYFELDGVHWGAQTNTEYNSTGQGIVAPFSGSENIPVIKKLFNAMLAKGHRKWDGKPTMYANDTSAFAMYEPDNNNNVPSDFANSAGMAQHEQPIKAVWVAGLQLVTVTNDRFPRFFKALYSGPQTQMGHRLINILSGQQAVMEQTTIQRVDYTEFQYQVQGIVSGIFAAATASAGNSAVELTGLFDSIDNTAWTLYLQNCIASAALLESPATLGYQDPFATYVPLPFGAQFIPRDPSGSSAYNMFILVVENLRRLKVVASNLGRIGDMFFYNAFSMSPPLFTTFTQFTGNPPIPASAWPISYDIATATDTVSNTIVSLNMAGVDALAGSFGLLADFMSASAPFTKLSVQTAEREMSGQQLTNLIRFVAPTPAARLGALPATESLKRSGSLKKEGTKLGGKQLLIFQSIRKPKMSSRLIVEDEPVSAAVAFSIGTQGAVGSRRPFNAMANKFYSCVIPITYIQLNPVGGTLMNAIAPAVSKLSVYSFWPVDSVVSSYYNNLMLQGLQTTYRAESSTTAVELLQIFQNHADAGLGGAAGDLTRMLFGFAKKDKWKKMGDTLAPIVDGVANAFPRTRKLNNMMGS